jgi:hypothetical protein
VASGFGVKFHTDCGCRCHGGRVQEFCCPECEPEAYDTCERCGCHRYQHNDDERPGSPGACAAFYDEQDDYRRTMAEREASGQLVIGAKS